MKNTTLPFIKTTDKETMNKLKDLGFQMVDKANGMYVFLNNDKLRFLNIDRSKIQYSNILTFSHSSSE